uniref:Uncharacterized protein n=1 Tax=Arundo donax TaxID=35708 RepID=A0A0A9BBI1_ARUDO
MYDILPVCFGLDLMRVSSKSQ